MTDPARVLSEFIDAWNRGERPEVDDYLARVPDDMRDDLADQISFFLQQAPTPRYSPETLAEIRADPVVQSVQGALEGDAGLWPVLLPRLRERARLRRDEIVSRLTAMLGIEGQERKANRYLHEMETGTLDPSGVSQRLLDALGQILGVSGTELAQAGDFATLGSSPAPAAAYYRARDDEIEVDAASTLARAADEPPEEVDRLFTGGR